MAFGRGETKWNKWILFRNDCRDLDLIRENELETLGLNMEINILINFEDRNNK
jgi:hypothetical protein